MAARFDTLKVRFEFSIIFYPLGVLVAVGKARYGEINECVLNVQQSRARP